MLTITENNSKLYDGVLSFFLICAFLFVYIILLIPFGKLGIPGYLSYGILCLATAFLTLKHSMSSKQTDIRNAWMGIIGGFAAWTVQEVSGTIGWVALEDGNGLILFILTGMAVLALWNILSIGPKFWFAMLLFNWGGHLLLKGQFSLCKTINPIFCTTMEISGYLAGAAIIGILFWIFTKSKTRIARLWAANWIWLMATIILYVIKGW